jgi:hypothetical protein
MTRSEALELLYAADRLRAEAMLPTLWCLSAGMGLCNLEFRRSEVRRTGRTHWFDPDGGEWGYHPEDESYNPHWDY